MIFRLPPQLASQIQISHFTKDLPSVTLRVHVQGLPQPEVKDTARTGWNLGSLHLSRRSTPMVSPFPTLTSLPFQLTQKGRSSLQSKMSGVSTWPLIGPSLPSRMSVRLFFHPPITTSYVSACVWPGMAERAKMASLQAFARNTIPHFSWTSIQPWSNL